MICFDHLVPPPANLPNSISTQQSNWVSSQILEDLKSLCNKTLQMYTLADQLAV